MNVSWGEPKQANGIIEGYRLVYEPCTPVDGEKSTYNDSFDIPEITLSNSDLQPLLS